MKKTSAIFTIILAVVSCSKDQSADAPSSSVLTIKAGYEERTAVESRTFIKDADAGTIWWGSTGVDRVLYVFDGTDAKSILTSESATPEAVRIFSSDTWDGGVWKYAVWTGCPESIDQCVLDGTMLSGPTLKVTNPQTINNSASFCNTANIAVMKPTDNVLKNVFGYLRFTLPTFPESTFAAIRQVTLTADENVAGDIEIDYSSDVPQVTVISNANASRSLTLNTRFKEGYEAGVVWMVLPAGTYHNASLTITPFTSSPEDQNASTGEPFTVNFIGDLVISRSKYTDCGTLPSVAPAPAPEPEPTPDPTPDPATWPEDTDAFDYGMEAGESKTADMTGFRDAGIANGGSIPDPYCITLDKITYCGKESKFYSNPRFVANRAKSFTKVSGVDIPDATTQNFNFKINRPGTLSFFPRYANIANDPVFMVALVTVTEEGTVARHIFSGKPASKSTAEADKNNEDCRINVSITESDMEGITQAATVYIYHKDVGEIISYYPVTWVVAGEE